MSAELLRKAATILRERAEAATPGPWGVLKRRDGDVWGIEAANYGEVITPGDVTCGSYCQGGSSNLDGDRLTEDADYIATMHPGVGLALADWLDVEAYHIESHDCAAHCEPDGCGRGKKAGILARLIVGEQP